jgi:hypothetical protein
LVDIAETPKDVCRLEALKPPNVPSMSERYKLAVAKERRLEVATLLVSKANDKNARGHEDIDNYNDNTVMVM